MGGSELDRTDDFQKFCGSGLDRIQFYRIRTGLGLINFTVLSSLVAIFKNLFVVAVCLCSDYYSNKQHKFRRVSIS